MALPKLETPTYELELPSTGEKIKYRPFLVKEQKLLMMAQESNDDRQMVNTMGDLVTSCTFNKVPAKTSPMFDVEYVFLQLRAKSVGETIELNVTCPDDEATKVKTKINLEEVVVQMTEGHTNEIELSDDLIMIMKYPILNDMSKLVGQKNQTTQVFALLNESILEIKYGDEIHNRKDMNKKELDEFIEQLTSHQFEKIMEFFNTMPKLRHIIEVENPVTNVKNEIVLEGLQNFLG